MDVPILRSAPFFPPFHHLNALELAGIASRDFHKAQLAAAPYHCVAYGSYEELLDNEVLNW